MLDETFERPLAFDLVAYWQDSTQRLSEEMHANEATLRLSPWGMQMLEPFTTPFARSAATSSRTCKRLDAVSRHAFHRASPRCSLPSCCLVR